MKKKSLLVCVIMIVILSMLMVFAGCNTNNNQSPKDIIENAFGNEEFKISFSKETLQDPIQDVKYSAKNIPLLPTPVKLGYIFEGWFFDINYTEPFSNDALYMHMDDVVLYAKWSKEDFTQEGIYDIKFESHIVEDTVVEGPKTKEYGSYDDLSKCIIEEETYIEKTEDKILLRIQYDAVYNSTYGQRAVYEVNMAANMPSEIKIDRSRCIDSLSDSRKTLYIDITKMDLTNPIYLSVSWINWKTVGLSMDIREDTITTYNIQFNIKQMIGFNQPFVNPDQEFEDGYYLVKTYYRKINNELSMGSVFNPVYSYLSAKDGELTLIKPFVPYAGLIRGNDQAQTGGEIKDDDYYDRLMSFMSVQLCVPIDFEDYGDQKVESEYYLSTYKAKNYVEFSYEFHKDTKRSYAIYNLGKNIKQSYMVLSAVSGFMEVMTGMGRIPQIMTIDYDHIIKLADIDYKPLEGEAYQYESQMQYYPEGEDDLNKKDLTFEAYKKNSLINMVHFFYSQSTIFDSRITVKPTEKTLAKPASEQRYEIVDFDVNTLVYGYDPTTNKDLRADIMFTESFGDTGLRERVKIKNGKAIEFGDTIWVDQLYKEKVDKYANFNDVKYEAYEVIDGEVCLDKPITIEKSFVINKNMAILFRNTNKEKNGLGHLHQQKCVSLVYLTEYKTPDITITNFDETGEFKIDDIIEFPHLRYDWMGNQDSYFQDYYAMDDEPEVNPIKTRLFAVEPSGVYTSIPIGWGSTQFKLSHKKMILQFMLFNEYGEMFNHYITLNVKEKDVAELHPYKFIQEKDGIRETVFTGNAKFDYDNNRVGVLNITTEICPNINDLDFYSYYLNYEGKDIKFTPSSVEIYKKNDTVIQDLDPSLSNEELFNLLNTNIGNQDYAYVVLRYKTAVDESKRIMLINCSINGSNTTDVFTNEVYFTDYEYFIQKPQIVAKDGTVISTSRISVDYNNKSKMVLEEQGLQYSAVFQNQDVYVITTFYTLMYDENGEFVFKDKREGVGVSKGETINTKLSTGDVTITYVTDAAHPFVGNSLTKAITYNLKGNILTVARDELIRNGDILFGWTPNKNYYPNNEAVIYAGEGIDDYVARYTSDNIKLYAVWDEGAMITAKFYYDDGSNKVEDISTRKYYMDTTGFYAGTYSFNASDFNISVPEGYVIDCYSGGVLKGKHIPSFANFHGIRESGYFYAVLKKVISVKYNVNRDLSGRRLGIDKVVDGNLIPDQDVKLKVTTKNPQHSFKYWAVRDAEGNMIKFDITNTRVTLSKFNTYGDGEVLNLYAIFDDGTGKEIW